MELEGHLVELSEAPGISGYEGPVREIVRAAWEGLLDDLETNDLMSLESYSNYGVHELDLTSDFAMVSERLDELNPSHYGPYTNMRDGLRRSIEELTGKRARSGARKVIISAPAGDPDITIVLGVNSNQYDP